VAEVLGEDAVDLLKAWELEDLREGFAEDLADTRRAGEVTKFSRFAPPTQVASPGNRDEAQAPSATESEIRLRVILSAEAVEGRFLVGVDDSGHYWELRPLRKVRVGSGL
jgi:hypothetical protein